MNAQVAAAVIAGLNCVVVLLLAADKWVHGITGRPSLESRVENLEKRVDEINEKQSEYASGVNVKIGAVELDVARLQVALQYKGRK